ncbi:RNA polymerase sigma factor [Lentzea sp. NPDC058436]|uniref:RNA polymerase sigma factor n=1 Tax=Lentzea sp. NPDC058436 TaxID=3346499 RepID=UPI0036682A32
MSTGDRTSTGEPGTDWAGVAALFVAARGGDRQAFHELVAMLSPLLWHVARAQGLDRESSQDVVQTAWLGLLRDMHGIRNPVALTGWLVTTTKRESWRVRERRGREVLTGDDRELDGTDAVPGPEALAVLDDRQRRLWAAVARLEQRCRDLLRIVAFIPRPDYGLIAETLGMKHGSVGPTRMRCLGKLRVELGDDADGEVS